MNIDFSDRILNRRPMPVDERDYKLATYLTPQMQEEALTRTYRNWKMPKILDQGNTPHCVGYAWAGFGVSYPVHDEWDNSMGDVIYYRAKEFDGEPGQENGSETRSGVKAFKTVGHLVNGKYAFAHSVNEIIVWLLTKGPVVTGTNWYSSMFEWSKSGLVKVKGSIVGGHEWMLSGVNKKKRLFTCTNSWGDSYGINGQFYISFKNYERLFYEQGDAVVCSESLG